jgi:hypothetical protein
VVGSQAASSSPQHGSISLTTFPLTASIHDPAAFRLVLTHISCYQLSLEAAYPEHPPIFAVVPQQPTLQPPTAEFSRPSSAMVPHPRK